MDSKIKPVVTDLTNFPCKHKKEKIYSVVGLKTRLRMEKNVPQ